MGEKARLALFKREIASEKNMDKVDIYKMTYEELLVERQKSQEF